MKQKLTIAILLVFCFSEIKPLLPLIEYCLNYEYISEVLCINKDEPILTCNGKCYLTQEIEKAQESEKRDNTIPTVEQERIPMITHDYNYPNIVGGDLGNQKISSFYKFTIKNLAIAPPTPPPKC